MNNKDIARDQDQIWGLYNEAKILNEEDDTMPPPPPRTSLNTLFSPPEEPKSEPQDITPKPDPNNAEEAEILGLIDKIIEYLRELPGAHVETEAIEDRLWDLERVLSYYEGMRWLRDD